MSNASPTAVPIPSPAVTPLTPELEDRQSTQLHTSPAFDYHEERRLHLKDEIWLSHHLPRLPPPSIPETSSSSPQPPSDPVVEQVSALPDNAAVDERHVVHSSLKYQRNKEDEDDEMGLGRTVGRNLQAGGAGMGISTSSPVGGDATGEHDQVYKRTHYHASIIPSELDDGDLDPARTLIHRQELDEQERLDLEAEKRERFISEAKDDLDIGSIELEPGEKARLRGDRKPAPGPEQGEHRPLFAKTSASSRQSTLIRPSFRLLSHLS